MLQGEEGNSFVINVFHQLIISGTSQTPPFVQTPTVCLTSYLSALSYTFYVHELTFSRTRCGR
jgi:hypothetical protein